MPALPVDEVWGIGRRISKNWTRWGSKPFSIWRIQISGLSVNILMSCSKERCVNCAVNPVCNWKSLHRRSRKLSVPCSFGERITDYPSMRQAICSYAARAAEKLRSEHQYCRFISTFIKTSPFAFNEPYYGNSASVKLLTPTQDSRDIINAATRSLDAIWQAGHRYQKAGVMLGSFFSQGVAQLNLFDDNAPRPGSEQLMAVMDTLNAKEGRGTLYFAGQGIQQQWQMKRAMLSPCYTTRSSDLLRVK